MKWPDSTYEILFWKITGRGVDDDWAKWAVDMLTNGFETEHLILLAGIEAPYNQFYLADLTDKVFQELNIEAKNEEKIIIGYVNFIAGKVLNGTMPGFTGAAILRNIYIETDFRYDYLNEFYLLYYAKDDLLTQDIQFYIESADKSNIDQMILDSFKSAQVKYQSSPLLPT